MYISKQRRILYPAWQVPPSRMSTSFLSSHWYVVQIVNNTAWQSVAQVAVALYAAIRTRMSPTRDIGYFVQWGLLVLPMLLAMTVSANRPLYLVTLLLIPTVAVLQLPRAEIGTPLPSNVPLSPSSKSSSPQARQPSEKIPPLPALTTYRAHMMLMTVLAILAVDFPVFPRSLAKCETFGVSLVCFLLPFVDKIIQRCVDGHGCGFIYLFARNCLRDTPGHRPFIYHCSVVTETFTSDEEIFSSHYFGSCSGVVGKRNGVSRKRIAHFIFTHSQASL